MVRAEVRKFTAADEFEMAERCFITEVANNPSDETVSIARARVEPGVTTAWHKLRDVAERYLIVSGQGRAEIGNLEPAAVTAGDVICIPPDMPQRITNTGKDNLIFFAVCSPRFTAGCYISLE
ncbi:MAG: cupin domain-containing protein [Kiritimatiellales bacterium]|jgi:mannose-6-phosphate isomerase-like protein (cupin superfamily)